MNFFKNLFKDIIRTIIVVVSAIAIFLFAPYLIPGFVVTFAGSTTMAALLLGTGIGLAAIGFDIKALQLIIAIVGLVLIGYALVTGGGFLTSAFGLSAETVLFLTELSLPVKAMILLGTAVLTAGLYVAIDQDISVLEGIAEVASTIVVQAASAFGHFTVSTISSLFSNPYVIVGGGLFAYYLFKRKDSYA